MSSEENWVDLGAVSINAGECTGIKAAGKSLALYNVDGDFFCTDNICTHQFALLTDGLLENNIIECPLHAGQFDVRTGKGLCAPITQDLRTYPVRLEDGKIFVNLAAA
jgi:naphthalene 1,2-dioxygenase system ferredoxin subunit